MLLTGQAACFLGQGKTEEAEAALQEAQDKDPNCADTLVNLMVLSHHTAQPHDVSTIPRTTNNIDDRNKSRPQQQHLVLMSVARSDSTWCSCQLPAVTSPGADVSCPQWQHLVLLSVARSDCTWCCCQLPVVTAPGATVSCSQWQHLVLLSVACSDSTWCCCQLLAVTAPGAAVSCPQWQNLVLLSVPAVTALQLINQYKYYSERNITDNIKIFLQLYMIMTNLLTCYQDLVSGGSYYTPLK